MLIPLILPPAIPLWQVALGTAFGVIIGKEIFGGTGMNILNPALTARAFLFFAYPAKSRARSGSRRRRPEGRDAGRLYGRDAAGRGDNGMAGIEDTCLDGRLPRLHAGIDGGDVGARLPGRRGAAHRDRRRVLAHHGGGDDRHASCDRHGLNAIGSRPTPSSNVPFWWHMVLGGWAFGTVYMATDPVTAAQTNSGRWIFGLLVGVLAVLIRVVNPAYPEGMMLAILFMNVFAPTIDYFVVRANVRRRQPA
jgi:Na+-transporting NADH:ubiquinone oxidoreductase subunit B